VTGAQLAEQSGDVFFSCVLGDPVGFDAEDVVRRPAHLPSAQDRPVDGAVKVVPPRA
jgi:hypothetical protein